MKLAVEAGRLAYPRRPHSERAYASASSPIDGLIASAATQPAASGTRAGALNGAIRRRAARSGAAPPQEGARRGRRALQRGADRARPGAAARRPRFPARAPASTITRSRRSTRRGTSCRRRRRRPGVKGSSPASSGGVVAPYLQRQLTFNSLARRSPQPQRRRRARSAPRADAIVAVLREHLAALAEFQSRLMLLPAADHRRTSTPRTATSGGRRARAERSLSGLAENSPSGWSRSPRASSGTRRGPASHRRGARRPARDARRRPAGFMTLKRELERLERSRGTAGQRERLAGLPAPQRRRARRCLRASAGRLQVRRLRGSVPRIARGHPRAARVATCRSSTARPTCSTSAAAAASSSICSRRAASRARGIDLNHEMAEVCRARGLDVTEADAVSYLAALPGRIARRHLRRAGRRAPRSRTTCCSSSSSPLHKLRPGGRLVLETLNPACWVAFFESYIRDITHVWPLHPETLKYLVLASGFTSAAIEFRSPVPQQDRLQPDRRAGRRGRPRQRSGRGVQRQRGEAEFANLHVPRLRGHCRTVSGTGSRVSRALLLAGTILTALFLSVVTASLFRLAQVPSVLALAVVAVAVYAAVRPHDALVLVAAVVPMSTYVLSRWAYRRRLARSCGDGIRRGLRVARRAPTLRSTAARRRAVAGVCLCVPASHIAAGADDGRSVASRLDRLHRLNPATRLTRILRQWRRTISPGRGTPARGPVPVLASQLAPLPPMAVSHGGSPVRLRPRRRSQRR